MAGIDALFQAMLSKKGSDLHLMQGQRQKYAWPIEYDKSNDAQK